MFNELRKGNLERFVTHTLALVDALVVYDDGSTDGSYEYLLSKTPHVIRNSRNDFSDEIRHKQLLLEEARRLGADFVLWLDADEVLGTDNPEAIQAVCAWSDEYGIDGVELHELNLWRSASWRRTDSAYDGWFVRLWRMSPTLTFDVGAKGLHHLPFPPSIDRLGRYPKLSVIHYGFSDDFNIANKYLTYREHGQRGFAMLDRFVNEDDLVLERIPDEIIPADLRQVGDKPVRRTAVQSLANVERQRDRVSVPGFTILCLIYKSVEWAKFVYEQVLRYTDMKDKEFLFVANDASPEVLEYLASSQIPHVAFTNSEAQRAEWYINNVYRAYNFGGRVARGDFVVFINSDMAFSPGWLEALWDAYDGRSVVASRLVESGKLPSGDHAIERDFGRTPGDYQEAPFLAFAEEIRSPAVLDGGLFMPLLVRRDEFLAVSGYPEGNIKPGSDIFRPTIASLGESSISGDRVLIQRLARSGIHHLTAGDSIAYHFQMGELDASVHATLTPSPIVAVCNDLVTGSMGERVLWDYLLDGIPSTVGIDTRVVGTDEPFAPLAKAYISKNLPNTSLIIQNATFIDPVDPDIHTVAFLQDDLRAMGRDSSQQERNLRAAQFLVTNSVQTALSYPEFDFHHIPVGVDSDLFRPTDKVVARARHSFGPETIGIFVGAFNEVKGWPEVLECIRAFPAITWILVTKLEETFEAPNVRTYGRIPQRELATLLNCADFFILGSRVETQALAAIEACMCDVPVVMRMTGIFTELDEEDRLRVGYFGDDLLKGVRHVLAGHFAPREVVLKNGWAVNDSLARWRSLVGSAMQEVVSKRVGFVGAHVPTDGSGLRYERRLRPPVFVPVPPSPQVLTPEMPTRRSRRRFLSPRYVAMVIRQNGFRWTVLTALKRALRNR